MGERGVWGGHAKGKGRLKGLNGCKREQSRLTLLVKWPGYNQLGYDDTTFDSTANTKRMVSWEPSAPRGKQSSISKKGRSYSPVTKSSSTASITPKQQV